MSGYFSSRLALKQWHLGVSGEKQLVTLNVTHVRLDERPLPNGTDAKNEMPCEIPIRHPHVKVRSLQPIESSSDAVARGQYERVV